jgi:hypothetical protein
MFYKNKQRARPMLQPSLGVVQEAQITGWSAFPILNNNAETKGK